MPFVSTKRGMFTGCKEPDDDDKKKQTKCVQIKVSTLNWIAGTTYLLNNITTIL